MTLHDSCSAADDERGEANARGLVARIAARDRLAFDELYQMYARRVLAFVRDIVVCAELAEEVASDAMIAVWRSAGRYRGESRVLTWVLAIAHHKAVDALRRRDTVPVALETLPSPGSDPADEMLKFEDRFVLDIALRALSADHRTVLQLMYGFGCSQAEISNIVGCPLATVKTRVFYAKRRLRDELERATAAAELA